MNYTSESERLRTYYPFDDDVLAKVEEVAGRQRQMSFEALNSSLPDNQPFDPPYGKRIQVMDTGPSDDSERTLVYHMAMGAGLDGNERIRLSTLAAAIPNTRIIAAASPGAPGNRSGTIAFNQFPNVFGGNLRYAVDPLLQYVARQKLEVITHDGYSLGADKAPTAAIYSSDYGQTVEQVISIEPTSVEARKLMGLKSLGILGLGIDFNSADAALEGYVQASNSDALNEGRRLASVAGHGRLGLILGLLRASNIASAKALSRAGYEGRVREALIANPSMRSDTVWGSQSELCISGLTSAIVSDLQNEFGPARVSGTIIEGQKHTMCDDIYLHAAIIAQTLKKNPTPKEA